MATTLNTAYKVQTDILETENGINIENGAIYLVDNKLKVHINDNIEEIPTAKYKVFTALLTQSGGDSPAVANYINQVTLIIGQSYEITINNTIANGGSDFTNVGASNNEVGTWFIATGENPIWGDSYGELTYNDAAPVATVLENTIGNVWFTYGDVGNYYLNSNGLFTSNKTTTAFMPNQYIESPSDLYNFNGFPLGSSIVAINSYANYNSQNNLYGGYASNSIEIRVYN